MENIIQISDLHFGSNDSKITQQLHDAVTNLNPDLVVVSGDLTMRARETEFNAAKKFLDTLPGKLLVIPGNHDVSLYNVFRRFFRKMERFHRLVTEQEESHYISNEVAVIGLNSSRSFTIKGGDISGKQIKSAKEILATAKNVKFNLIVTHHPVYAMKNSIRERLMNLGVNVFLSGHNHKSNSKVIEYAVNNQNKKALFIEAGTAISTRYRNEQNSFNQIVIDQGNITVKTFTLANESTGFEVVKDTKYDL